MTKTRVPPGSPPWVTEEMIADTLRVWQPYYKEKLTEDDALEMLLNVSHLLDALGLTRTAKTVGPEAAAIPVDDEHIVQQIRECLERPDLTPIQEGRLYEIMTLEINPVTREKWKLKEIAEHFGKPYVHVRSRWDLVVSFNADKVGKNGKIVGKGQGLTDEERSAFEHREKTLTGAIRQALRCETKQGAATSPVSLEAMQELFDSTDEDNVERRKAIAECMGLTFRQATKASHERKASEIPDAHRCS